MISHSVYLNIHLFGIFLTLTSLAGLGAGMVVDSTKLPVGLRRSFAIAHGLGLFLVLLGGFGMMARLGIRGDWPLWIQLKLGLWFVLGGMIALVRRVRIFSISAFVVIPLLAALGAWFAINKPI